MKCKKRKIAVSFIKFIMLLLAGVALYEILGKDRIADFFNKITINILAIILFFILTFMIYYYFKYNKSEKQILKIMIGIAKICLIAQVFMFEMFILIGFEENKNKAMYVYFIILYSLLYIGVSCKYKIICEESEKNDDGELFGIREKQAEVLRELIKEEKENSMILIDGEWGIGKTFFIKKALEAENEEWEQIFIDVMMFNGRKALNEEFFNSIEKIFEENGIMRKSAENLKNQISKISETDNKFINMVIEMIKRETIDKTFEDGKESLGEAIKKLDKKIVLVIDNLERILKHDDIIEILGFLYEMQSIEGITVIVCADKEKLIDIISKEKFEKQEEYIEKFFIKKIEITKIEPIEIIEKIGEREEYKEYKHILIKVVKEILENNNRSDNELKEVVLKLENIEENKKELTKEYEDVKKIIIEFERIISIPRNIEKLYEKLRVLEKRFNNIYGEKNIINNRYMEIICGISLLNIFCQNEYSEIKNGNYLNVNFTIVVNKEQFILNVLRFKLKDKQAYLRIIEDFKISDEDIAIKFIENFKENNMENISAKEVKKYFEILLNYYRYLDSEDKSIEIYRKMRKKLIETDEIILEMLGIVDILELEKRYCIENGLNIRKESIFQKLKLNNNVITFILNVLSGDDLRLKQIENNIKKVYWNEIKLYSKIIFSNIKEEVLTELEKKDFFDLFETLIMIGKYGRIKFVPYNKKEKKDKEQLLRMKNDVLEDIEKKSNTIINKNGEKELINRMIDLFDILELLEDVKEEKVKENKNKKKFDILNFENKSYIEQLKMIEKMEKIGEFQEIEINIEEQEKYIKQPLKIRFFNVATKIEKIHKINEN